MFCRGWQHAWCIFIAAFIFSVSRAVMFSHCFRIENFTCINIRWIKPSSLRSSVNLQPNRQKPPSMWPGTRQCNVSATKRCSLQSWKFPVVRVLAKLAIPTLTVANLLILQTDLLFLSSSTRTTKATYATAGWGCLSRTPTLNMSQTNTRIAAWTKKTRQVSGFLTTARHASANFQKMRTPA